LHFHNRSIMVPEWISQFSQSQSPIALTIFLNHSLRVYL
jgi:hypothetical protein